MDISTAGGDSGGPLFLGKQLILGVVHGSTGQTTPPSKWGDVLTNTRVSVFRTFLDDVIAAPTSPSYDLVLDMKYQVYGQPGTDGEKISITAKKNSRLVAQ